MSRARRRWDLSSIRYPPTGMARATKKTAATAQKGTPTISKISAMAIPAIPTFTPGVMMTPSIPLGLDTHTFPATRSSLLKPQLLEDRRGDRAARRRGGERAAFPQRARPAHRHAPGPAGPLRAGVQRPAGPDPAAGLRAHGGGTGRLRPWPAHNHFFR